MIRELGGCFHSLRLQWVGVGAMGCASGGEGSIEQGPSGWNPDTLTSPGVVRAKTLVVTDSWDIVGSMVRLLLSL